MRRRTFDTLMSAGGVLVTLVLLIAGTLLFVGANFAQSSVESQLRAQSIFFPPEGSPALDDPRIEPHVTPYAGQQLVTGEHARVYADHFIGVHLQDVAEGKTFAEMSTLARQNPDDATMARQVDTLFRGETLRGMLLNAYAFWTVGQIARLAGFAALGLAAVMALLTALGFWHLRRVPPTEEFLEPIALERKSA